MRRPLVAPLLIAGLLLAACGPAVVPTTPPETETGEVFMLALPQIVMTFDDAGRPGIEGFPVEDIARALNVELNLDAFRIHPYAPRWMTEANIQHIELRNTGDAIALLVNGALMPGLSYRDGALERAGDLAVLLGPGSNAAAIQDLIVKLAPIVRRTGLSLVAEFPLQPGAAPIPLSDPNARLAPLAPPPPSSEAPMFMFEIRYDEQGVPSTLGISARDLVALIGNAPLALDPDYLRSLQQNNIQHIQIRTQPTGLHLYANGTPLPSLIWDEKTLDNAVEVYARMNSAAPKEVLYLVRMLVPVLARADISMMFHFPLAPGVTPIPAQMQ